MSIEATKFTPRAQKVIAQAMSEASNLGQDCVGTEHLLLGLIAVRDNTACEILKKLGVVLGELYSHTFEHIGHGPDDKVVTATVFAPRVLMVFKLAETEAKSLGQEFVGTEHLLLALVAESDCVAARMLKKFSIAHAEDIRKVIQSSPQPQSVTAGDLQTFQAKDIGDLAYSALKILDLPEDSFIRLSGLANKSFSDLCNEIFRLLVVHGSLIHAIYHERLKLLLSKLISSAPNTDRIEKCIRALVAILGAEKAAQMADIAFAKVRPGSGEYQRWGTALQLITGKPVQVSVNFVSQWPPP